MLQRRQTLNNSSAIFYRMNLITELLMFNGHRAGVVTNMTMKDWHDGQWVDNCYTVTVSYYTINIQYHIIAVASLSTTYIFCTDHA